MSITTELIKKLREYADDPELDMCCDIHCQGDCNKLLREAADTIEKLSAKLHASQMERSSQYYHGGWIPVDERLPEPDNLWQGKTFLVSVIIGDQIVVKSMFYDYYNKKWDTQKDTNVIAWQPLPEPYTPE